MQLPVISEATRLPEVVGHAFRRVVTSNWRLTHVAKFLLKWSGNGPLEHWRRLLASFSLIDGPPAIR
ncbi:hypothetical protein E2C01_072086 [Portunus trituberculatus]|uniref:Uncharacterized protein n=1 Tax=Portunus trituberculatus TaxID=210409 RepID=A0A5B7I9T3_PORTR|nr:hypothetical protein [Portunus trituberculatus]